MGDEIKKSANQPLKANLELRNEVDGPVPGFDPELGTRLKWVIDRIGSQKAAGNVAGVKAEMIGKYIAGKAKPSFYSVRSLADAAGVRLDWLASGEGDPYEGPSMPGVAPVPVGLGDGDQVDLPIMATRLSGGGGSFLDGQNITGYQVFSRRWLRDRFGALDPANLCIVGVVGDSMEPTIHQGDDLMIDLSQKTLLDNAIYAIRWDGALVVKRLQRMLDGITIISDNPLYKPETISRQQADQMAILGRVRWIGKVL